MFNFTGSNAGSATFGSSGGTLAAGPYAGLTANMTFGTIQNYTTAIAIQDWLASGNGDISSTSSIAFPPFATTTHVDSNGNTLAGSFNLVGYLKFQATPEVTFVNVPAIALTVTSPASVVGTTCWVFSITNIGSNGAIVLGWKQTESTTTVSPSQVSFAAKAPAAGQTVDLGNPTSQATDGNGPAYLAVACQ